MREEGSAESTGWNRTLFLPRAKMYNLLEGNLIAAFEMRVNNKEMSMISRYDLV